MPQLALRLGGLLGSFVVSVGCLSGDHGHCFQGLAGWATTALRMGQ